MTLASNGSWKQNLISNWESNVKLKKMLIILYTFFWFITMAGDVTVAWFSNGNPSIDLLFNCKGKVTKKKVSF